MWARQGRVKMTLRTGSATQRPEPVTDGGHRGGLWVPVVNRAEADPGPCSVWICLVVRHICRTGRQFLLLPLLAPLDPGQGQKGAHEARGLP